jgi:hypothetical protein
MTNNIETHLSKNKDILIYINGSLHRRQDAKISVYDSGFLMGDGIWEGLRLVNGSWIFLDEHLDRLFEPELQIIWILMLMLDSWLLEVKNLNLFSSQIYQ